MIYNALYARKMIRYFVAGITRWLVLALVLALVFSQAHADQTLLRLSNATLPPMTMSNGGGYLDHIAGEMFGRAGLDVELLKLPSARGLAMANSGSLDGELARVDVPSDYFPNLLKVPEPIVDVEFAGLYRRSGIIVNVLEDFKRYRVGFIRGWVIAETLFAGESNVEATSSVVQLLDMLDAGRIDIAFMTVAPGLYLAEKRGMSKPGITDFSVKKNLHLYVHAKHAGKIPGLTRALASMKEDGRHEAILRESRLGFRLR